MQQVYATSNEEYQGSRDSIGGLTLTDARVAGATLGALNAELLIDIQGKANVYFEIRAAANAATYVFEGSLDGTNYYTLPVRGVVGTLAATVVQENIVSSVVVATSAAAVYAVNSTGWRRIRCRVSAYTSGTATVTARGTVSDLAIIAQPQPSMLHVTATAAVNTGSTCTLPAAAGLFHYITKIELVKLYNVVGVAAGAGMIITSTNLPGTPAWTTEQLASAAGTAVRVIDANYQNPLKSLVANTATTFVAGAQLQTIWRWNVSYYQAA